MNANEILDMIGDAKGTYLWETQKYRDGTAGAKPLPLPRRRLWLVAAVIGLMLLLVGCTVAYVLRLQDMAFGQETQEAFEGDIRNRTLLSLQGVKGTPGYQATKEWYEWLQTYDTDMSIYHS